MVKARSTSVLENLDVSGGFEREGLFCSEGHERVMDEDETFGGGGEGVEKRGKRGLEMG